MDDSKSPVKVVKPSRSNRGNNSSSKPQRENPKAPSRSKDGVPRVKEDLQGSRSSGRTRTGSPQEPEKAKARRLTGRTNSGERGKGKTQAQLSEARQQAQESKIPGRGSGPGKDAGSTSLPSTHEERESSMENSTITDKDKTPGVDAGRQRGKPAAEVTEVMELGNLTSDQQLGLKQAEERLQRDYIHRLLKQSPEYPNFQYLCKLCSVHVENIQGAHKHIKEKRHKKNIMEKQEENELRALPPPSLAQLRALDCAVLEAAKVHGISDEDFQLRQAVVSRMEDIIRKQLSACSLRLYGSCFTRFAFKTSDINIDVSYPSTMTQPDVLIQVLEILKNSVEFVEVESDFHAKVPVVFCRDVASGLMCKVSAGNDVACLTTNHLAALARLEPRLVPLVLAFRYWANLCHIDCQAEGGIPSYSLSLMVIFFLQQREKPVLPVYLGSWIKGFEVTRVDEYHLTGMESSLFVGWEHRPAPPGEGRGEGKAKPEPKNPTEKREKKGQHMTGKARLTLEVTESASLGQLWLELLRFYTLEFALEEHIISIRLRELLPRELKHWPRRRLAIEDPFALKRNVARSLNSQMVFEYIQERFRMAYKYFARPQSRNAAIGSRRIQRKKPRHHGRAQPHARDDTAKSDSLKRKNTEKNGEEDDDGDSSDNEEDEEEKLIRKGFTELLVKEMQDEVSSSAGSPSTLNGLLMDSDEEEDNEEHETEQDTIAPEDMHYIFDRMIFTGGKPPTVVCSICKRDGHLKDECPEDFKKIELIPLPPMTELFRDILDGLCLLCYRELSPSLGEQQKREQILAGLERFIRKEYNDKAQLCLFGSSKNGFGFRDSDLDICMTLEGHDTAEKLNCKEIIEGLAKMLKKHTGLRNILPITTAKVPIVKFEHRQSGLEGDISLYNTLAQHNTRMLATYAAIDPRVQYLGYTMKVFAKRCDIGDASRGSLSSYAYILMVLYFLQQRQPPVIPVLQEIFDGNTVPQRMVDGWNAFFFDDLDELQRRLPELHQNKESVGELWLGLLRFYTEEFDFKEHVISIRQRKRLTTFEKQWTSKCIAIEDPFDLNHNLGAGVSRKMTNFIMKAFINGRKLFGTPFYPQPGTEADYFFDSKVLTDGELAPNDRCCRICGKIGHYMKDCPKRRRIKKKENEREEEVREEEREPRERRCFQCGDMGHVRRDCPDYKHLRQRGAPGPVPHMVRGMASSQSIPIPQGASVQDRVGRNRQTSECSDTRQTPPYSPQPSPYTQASVSPPNNKPSSSSSTSAGLPKPSKPQQQHVPQVQLPIFNFPHSHPGQYHHAGLSALGRLPSHGQQPALTAGSWPVHGPIIQGSGASTGSVHPVQHASTPGLKFAVRGGGGNGGGQAVSPAPVNLNDPSIIFAQPSAGRVPGGVGVPGRERGHHWHNHHLNPGALMGNGTVNKTDPNFVSQLGGVNQGSRSWEHSNAAQYSLSPSYMPYRMPPYLQQPNKPYISQGSVVANQHYPLIQRGRHVNLNYIQQKK
ncbi:terminal uridylyltransferase 4-like isoform X2 [Myxocyprinus asiaticus]|uniref:terminal uridylyltransferase 4-like isoform X2 n=1 Tax=Myxocyprinus asiaticus TaxID=70543 RepID=UPI002221A913|nr:terminal uridylyltransferase 4-like isoform X2 [Myxocyprinus asiaticus]